MAGATSAPEGAAPADQRGRSYRRIVVIGGGCYGSYYVRQLGRASRAGAISWEELVVVDRDAGCAIGRLPPSERPPRTTLAIAAWRDFLARELVPGDHGATEHVDAIVPSPLMPHLLADWLVDRARSRWPGREVRVEPLEPVSAVPWQRRGDDGTHYVSFAEWMCPINCIEPARCPHTRSERHWSLPVAVGRHAAGAEAAGLPVGTPLLFHCTHRAYGVGMIDLDDVVAADRTIAAHADTAAARFLIGTVSHCHGALRRVVVGAAERERPGSIADFSR